MCASVCVLLRYCQNWRQLKHFEHVLVWSWSRLSPVYIWDFETWDSPRNFCTDSFKYRIQTWNFPARWSRIIFVKILFCFVFYSWFSVYSDCYYELWWWNMRIFVWSFLNQPVVICANFGCFEMFLFHSQGFIFVLFKSFFIYLLYFDHAFSHFSLSFLRPHKNFMFATELTISHQ